MKPIYFVSFRCYCVT